jgi:DNA polymerase I-like protein with 3'-5' exonuclease and polymerase domains
VTAFVLDQMEHAYELSVPIQVEAKVGSNWDEMTPVGG